MGEARAQTVKIQDKPGTSCNAINKEVLKTKLMEIHKDDTRVNLR